MFNRKTTRNFAVTTMAATAAVAAVAPAVSATEYKGYPDVPENNSHYEAIKALTEQGVVQGYENGDFGVFDFVTRGQVAVMLTEALNLEIPENVAGVLEIYDDVDEDTLYAEQIAAVTAKGIFSGDRGSYNPDKDITREQMATALVIGFDLNEYDTDETVDANVDNVSPSHLERVQTLLNLEISNQTDDFRPGEPITRGAFSTMVHLSQKEVGMITPATGVESVRAMNDTVDVNGTLEFAVNGNDDAADLEKIKEEGYTVEFKASKAIFDVDGTQKATSSTGKVNAQAGDEFVYQVVISKDDKEVAKSERQAVEVQDYDKTVTGITGVEVTNANGQDISDGQLALGDNITLTTKGTVKGSDDEKTLTNAKFAVDRPAVLSVTEETDGKATVEPKAKGTATVTLTVGEGEAQQTKKVTFNVGAERAVDATNSTIDKNSASVAAGKTEKVIVQLKDQYGLPMAADVTANNSSEDDKVINNEVTGTQVTDKDDQALVGKYELALEAVNETATGDVVIKAGDTEIGKVSLTVQEAGEADTYELTTDNAEFDLKTDEKDAATSSVELKAYDKNGLETDLPEGVNFDYESSDKDVVTVDSDGTVTLAGNAKTGDKATVKAFKKTGAFKDTVATTEFTVVDSTPVITDVTFTSTPTVTKETELDLSDILNVTATGSKGDVKVAYTVADGANPTSATIYEAKEDGTASEVELGTVKLTSNPNDLNIEFSQVEDGGNSTGQATVNVNLGDKNNGTFNIAVVDNKKEFQGDITVDVNLATPEAFNAAFDDAVSSSADNYNPLDGDLELANATDEELAELNKQLANNKDALAELSESQWKTMKTAASSAGISDLSEGDKITESDLEKIVTNETFANNVPEPYTAIFDALKAAYTK